MSEWARRFEDLEVFQRAYRLSLEVHEIAGMLQGLSRRSCDP